MNLSLRSIKNNNWSADNLKNMSPRLFVHYSQRYSHVTLVSGYLFENLARLSANQSVHTIAFSQVKEKGFTDKLEWYFINVLGNAFKFDSKSFIKKNRSKFVVVSCHHSSANKSSSFFFHRPLLTSITRNVFSPLASLWLHFLEFVLNPYISIFPLKIAIKLKEQVWWNHEVG